MSLRFFYLFLLVALLPGLPSCRYHNKEAMKVLVYTKTEGFRHEAIGAGKAGFEVLAQRHNWVVDFREEPEVFRSDALQNYDLVVFLLTTGSVWLLEDEWYSFDRNPRSNVEVLISIDEASYEVDDNPWFEGVEQRMGDHPLVWYREVGRGRVFQTALGHRPELYADPLFLMHLAGAAEWTALRK